MASPEAARSPWVNREIEHWVATKSADKILPVVTDGEWRWDPQARDFDESSTAVPPALRGVFDEEPLYLDLRWARNDQHLSLRHSRFRDAIAQLAAPMHGVSKDDLEGEDVRQHRRAGRLRLGAVASLVALTLLASVTGMFAVRNAAEANASAVEARKQQQEATTQRGSAERFAGEAKLQEEEARRQEARAKDAAAEADRLEDVASEQKARAEQASAETERQLAKADKATQRAREQQRLAQRQGELARQSAQEARKQEQRAKEQERIAREQQRLAGEAGAEAQRLKEIAAEQERLAKEAGAEARRQEQIAKEQEKRAQEEAEEAGRQLRIAIGRRLVNEAKEAIDNDPPLALRLGAAAQTINPGGETSRDVANLVTSTRYAGSIGDATAVAYGWNDLLVTRNATNNVSLWNVQNRANPVRLSTIGEPTELPAAMALSPDSKMLAVVRNGGATLWDVTEPAKPSLLVTLPDNRVYATLAFSPDGRTLATGDRTGYNGYATLWDISEPNRPVELSVLTGGRQFPALGFAFSADGRTLVAAHQQAVVWDITNPAEPALRSEIQSWDGVKGMSFSSAAPLVAIGDSIGRLTLYDLTNPAEPVEKTKLPGHETPLNGVAFSPDGRLLASGDYHGTTIVWEIGEFEQREFTRMKGQGVTSVAFSPDRRTLATTDLAGTAVLWNVREVGAPRQMTNLNVNHGMMRGMWYAPDGRSMTVIGGDGTAAFWGLNNRSEWSYRGTKPVSLGQEIDFAEISPDGRTTVVSRYDGRVVITDVSDPRNPQTLASMQLGWGGAELLTYSPDGAMLAIGGNGEIVLWNVTRPGNPERLGQVTVPRYQSMAAAFSPDGRTLAVANNQTVGVWDISDPVRPELRSTLAGHGTTVMSLLFSPDGTAVVSGSDDRTAIVWDVSDPTAPLRLTTLSGHSHMVSSLGFSHDGRTLATGDALGWVIMWDVAQITKPARLAKVRLEQGRNPRRLSFNAAGNTLAVGMARDWQSAEYGLWDLTEQNRLRANPLKAACSIAGHGLTFPEWVRHIPELKWQPTCVRPS